jgi:hypothetical protein
VAGHALVEAEPAEQAECRRQVLLSVEALFFDGAVLAGQQCRGIATRESLGFFGCLL